MTRQQFKTEQLTKLTRSGHPAILVLEAREFSFGA